MGIREVWEGRGGVGSRVQSGWRLFQVFGLGVLECGLFVLDFRFFKVLTLEFSSRVQVLGFRDQVWLVEGGGGFGG